MPSSDVKNYFFKNNRDLTFNNMSSQWGIDSFSSSNGAAYVDLDNDGDLDLVVNNINKPAFIYRNESNVKINHYLEIKLQGENKNTQGLGSKIYVFANSKQQYQEQMTAKGYQSSVTPVMHFGLGKDSIVDSLKIVWLSGKMQVLKNVKANQFITLNEKDAAANFKKPYLQTSLFEETKSPITYKDSSKDINDFKRQPLLINPLSYSGPCLVKGDVNNDKLDDIYVGGNNDKAGCLYIQQANGSFIQRQEACFRNDKASEDVDGLFFDANGDGYNDLYVVSGSIEPGQSLDIFQDRLYRKGLFCCGTKCNQ
jgi:hypothetical protein